MERATCKRVVFFGLNRDPEIILEETELPTEIADGQILAKVLLATICGSDLHTLNGKRVGATPSVLGHESVVEVIKSKRDGINSGDRITHSMYNSCHNCKCCNHDVEQKCVDLYKYGQSHISVGGGFTGGYSTHILLGAGTRVAKLPDNIPDSVASTLNCALATMMHAVDYIPQTKHYKRAVIQGAGMLGLYGCALLKEMGFADIYCVDIDARRLAIVSQFGAEGVHTSNADFFVKNKSDIDVVIEVSGNKTVVNQGMDLLRPGGHYLMIGMVHPDSQLDLTGQQLIIKCISMIGVHNYKGIHLDKSVDFLKTNIEKYPFAELISQPYSLEDFETAVKVARSQQYIRVAIKP